MCTMNTSYVAGWLAKKVVKWHRRYKRQLDQQTVDEIISEFSQQLRRQAGEYQTERRESEVGAYLAHMERTEK